MVHIGPLNKTSPSTLFNMDAYVESQNIGGNYSTVRVIIRAYVGAGGNTTSRNLDWGQQVGSIDGIGNVVVHAGDPFMPSGYAANQLRWADSNVINVGHNPDGTRAPVTVRMYVQYGSVNESHTATLTFPTIPRLPNAPYGLSVRPGSVTGISFGVDYTRSSAAPFDRPDQAQWSTNAAFTAIVWTDDNCAGYTNPAGMGVALAPLTQHWVRVRSHTAAGWGPWSSAVSGTTIGETPPGIAVSPSVSGTSASLLFTPAPTLPLPTKYSWERRRVGTTSPVASGESTTTTATVTGLTAGYEYEWRASEWFHGYQSPWSTWSAITQPQPSTSPGAYFDGSTAAGSDATYSWDGATGLSTSKATGTAPTGWMTFADGAGDSGGTGTVSRASAGRSRQFGARVQFHSDATAEGFRAGLATESPGWSTVAPGSHTGSVYVKVEGRTQRLAALITWYTAAGAWISDSIGADILVGNGLWTRLSVVAEAPDTADRGSVQILDVDGDGWSLWLGGDSFVMDDAMITRGAWTFPFFDGSLPDTGGFVYEWDGTPDASTSTRDGAGADTTIVDPDCDPVPAPPRPPIIQSDCIDDVVEWRRFWTMLDAVSVPTWLDAVPILKIQTGPLAERQVRIRFYPNPFNFAPQNIGVDTFCSEQILSYVPPSTVVTLDGISSTAIAQPSGSAPSSINHLIYGSNGEPPEWPVLTCGTPYMLAIDIPIDATPGNLSVDIQMVVRH